jgi:hypothetical protein
MEKILKYTKANVRVTDETGAILFEDHNLFVDSGRALIAQIFMGTSPYGPGFDYTKIVCDLGNNSTPPAIDNIDLAMISPPFSAYPIASIGIYAGYPVPLSGEPTGVHFQFRYTASGDQTIKELGLFYRPYVVGSPTFPERGDNTALYTGTMITRLKTTLSSIVVGNGRIITIDWKIIF